MLVLLRKEGDWIMIGENIRITVKDIRPDSVKIGVEAPLEMNVSRPEFSEKPKTRPSINTTSKEGKD